MFTDSQRMVLRKFLYNRKNLREFDITPLQQCILLSILDHHSDIVVTQRKISEEINCAQSSISRSLNKLAKSGFVKRHKHTTTLYGAPIFFNIYRPSEHFFKIAERWYTNVGSKEEDILKIQKKEDRIDNDKNKKMLEAMGNLSLKTSLWDDEGRE